MTEKKNVKVTKRMRFDQLLAIEEVKANADLVAFIEHEKELLAKKNVNKNGEKKLTATQKANEEMKTEILDIITQNGSPMTITEIWKVLVPMHPDEELTNQKISALVRQLKEDLVVERTMNKGKAYFGFKSKDAEVEE